MKRDVVFTIMHYKLPSSLYYNALQIAQLLEIIERHHLRDITMFCIFEVRYHITYSAGAVNYS